MNSIQIKAEKRINELIETADKSGIKAGPVVKASYNYESVMTDGREKVKLQVYFGKKGIKIVLQGNRELKLYRDLNAVVFGEDLFSGNDVEIKEPEAYIGTDESGKGDYFGPLVIAGVFVDRETAGKLRVAGVKDSKELSDSAINRIAGEVKKIVGNAYNIIMITPGKYNKLYGEFKNVNRLLGWGHARVLENILGKFPAQEAISDKFGDEKYIRNSLQTEGKNLLLHQMTKAERFTAVAAASILARNKLNQWFDGKGKELNVVLPKGASSGVEDKAVELKNKYGSGFLTDLVKLHFKTSVKIKL